MTDRHLHAVEDEEVIDVTGISDRPSESASNRALTTADPAPRTPEPEPQPALMQPVANPHLMDILSTSLMGGAIGFLLGGTFESVGIGAGAGASFALWERVALGPRVGVNQEQRVLFAVLGLGATVGTGYAWWRR